jgi:sugar-specific transcriptional regulator TrmB
MDQNITVINATEEFLKTQMSALQEALTAKDEYIQRLNQRSYADSANLNRIVEGMQEWTLESLSNESITTSQAEEIAEICGFELTKEVEVEVTVTYNLTLQVPHDEDAESIVNDIDFESVSYNSDYVTWLSSSVDRIDF